MKTCSKHFYKHLTILNHYDLFFLNPQASVTGKEFSHLSQ